MIELLFFVLAGAATGALLIPTRNPWLRVAQVSRRAEAFAWRCGWHDLADRLDVLHHQRLAHALNEWTYDECDQCLRAIGIEPGEFYADTNGIDGYVGPRDLGRLSGC